MAKAAQPKPDTTAATAPQGRKIENWIATSTLRPGIGKLTQRTQEPQYCGAIVGRCLGYTSHPNAKNPSILSHRLAGEFIGICWDGTTIRANEAYLPASLTRSIRAALDLQAKIGTGEIIDFAIEIWCEPDSEERQTPLGFHYVCYDRKPTDTTSPLLSLAYSANILTPPPPPPASIGYDPDTGEELS